MNIGKIARAGVFSLAIALAMGLSTPQAATAQTREINQAIKQLSEAMGDRQTIADARSAIEAGHKLYDKGDPTSLRQAVVQFQKAIQISRRQKDQQMLGGSLIMLGGTYHKLNETPLAIATFEEALSLLPDLDLSLERQQKLKVLVGGLYLMNFPKMIEGNPQQAKQEMERALWLFDSAKFAEGKAYALLGIASLQAQQSQFEEAKANLQMALPIFQQFKEQRGEASSLMLLGSIHVALQQPAEGLNYLKQSEKMFETISDRQSLRQVREVIKRLQS
jgi:tetratricopeptide (TPR) repeat protein